MTTPPHDTPDDRHREWLSALADGQVDPAALDHAPARWAGDAGLRQAWLHYHLIGDVLRSDELAQDPARDEAFLHTLRQRLRDEPVVLAPAMSPGVLPSAALARDTAPLAAAQAGGGLAKVRLGWRLPVAAAAGVAAVAGVLVMTRLAGPGAAPDAAGPTLAGSAVQGGQRVALEAPPAGPAGAATLDGELVRDARLDAYLRAHREARGPGALAAPGAGVRQVDFAVPPR